MSEIVVTIRIDTDVYEKAYGHRLTAEDVALFIRSVGEPADPQKIARYTVELVTPFEVGGGRAPPDEA